MIDVKVHDAGGILSDYISKRMSRAQSVPSFTAFAAKPSCSFLFSDPTSYLPIDKLESKPSTMAVTLLID